MYYKAISILVVLSGWMGGILQSARYIVQAQDTSASTGTLVVMVRSPAGDPLNGLAIDYNQVNHDFLVGFSGPAPEDGWPDAPYGLSLDLRCIPWSEIESLAGIFPYQTEESTPAAPGYSTTVVGNDCLLYFGEDALEDLPSDLSELSFDEFMRRAQDYLEHAVRYQASRGVSLFIIKEPGYPGANMLGFTASQWLRLVKLACRIIRQIDPQAMIVIEIIPQYLPSRGYTPYTFLDTLIRDGVVFDGIMPVFSAPIAPGFTRSGYPNVEWVSTQVATFSELGKSLIVRFSGIPSVRDDESRQSWLEEIYNMLFNQPTVIGIFWDEINRFPVKLTAVNWPSVPTEVVPSPRIGETILDFIRFHTSLGQVMTDQNGQAVINGYAGLYTIRIEGFDETVRTHIYRGEERRLDIVFPDKEATRRSIQTETPKPSSSQVDAPGRIPIGISLLIMAALMLGLGVYYWYNHKSKSG